jgi:hypothetical protein
MSNVIERTLEALEEIVEGRGPFSTDPLTHAANCIEAMQEQARAAIAELRRYEVVEDSFLAPAALRADVLLTPAVLLVQKEDK